MDDNKHRASIYLAGGCFWGMQAYFDKLIGIEDSCVGYANGICKDTTYQSVASTDHAETLLLIFDETKISLKEILLHYFSVIEPESINKQGGDIGRQYRTAVFYDNEDQLKDIEAVFDLQRKKFPHLAVLLEPLNNFCKAGDYHQNYLQKNPEGYCHIKTQPHSTSLLFGEVMVPTDADLKADLDNTAYKVEVEAKTEAPWSSPLNNVNEAGIYVDKATGVPLFASQDKFESGCGWPSFTKPILTDAVSYNQDLSFNMMRTEVTTKEGDFHLGHVFSDGPVDKGGKRYCINGAALRFIPLQDMESRGYGAYKILVESN